MTRYTALLAIALDRGQAFAASRFLTALLGFVFGVALATAMNAVLSEPPDRRRDLQRVLLLEPGCLVCCAALWGANREPLQTVALYAIVLLSFLSARIQAVAAASVNISGVNTIAFTSALFGSYHRYSALAICAGGTFDVQAIAALRPSFVEMGALDGPPGDAVMFTTKFVSATPSISDP